MECIAGSKVARAARKRIGIHTPQGTQPHRIGACAAARSFALCHYSYSPQCGYPRAHCAHGVCVWQNILHRDLKPANIFLTQNMDVLLGDFGMSRQLQAMATQRTTYAYLVGDTQ